MAKSVEDTTYEITNKIANLFNPGKFEQGLKNFISKTKKSKDEEDPSSPDNSK